MTYLPGKGMYTWQLRDIAGGSPWGIVDVVLEGGFSHVLVKIADGIGPYNISVDLPAIVEALQAAGIVVYGWHYVYGFEPYGEANRAIAQINATGVTGYIIDAEVEYKHKPAAAIYYMDLLRVQTNVPIGLSTYRYPTYHPEFPFREFLAGGCDFVMPQVYWEQAHNPVEQLLRSHAEYQVLAPSLPYLPTGAAYTRGGWAVTPAEIPAFLDKARALGFEGANFWELAHARRYLPAVYQAIVDYDWPVSVPEPEPEPEPPGGDDLAIEEALDRINQTLIEIRDKIGIGGGTDPGEPGEPEPPPVQWKRVQVQWSEKRINAWHIVGQNAAGKPILDMYPSSSAPVNERIQFLGGQSAGGPETLDVYPDKLDKDSVNGDHGFWQIAPHEYDAGLPDLYLQEFEVIEL